VWILGFIEGTDSFGAGFVSGKPSLNMPMDLPFIFAEIYFTFNFNYVFLKHKFCHRRKN